ncbi:MAG: hypothetical protein IIW48_02865 [Clostridia bacterium]|nr:hypothetical protein [Clostridia bacterium]
MEMNKIGNLILKLRNDKKVLVMFSMIVIGIILIVISSLLSERKKEDEISDDTNAVFDEEKYTDLLEKKLEEMISLISGAGQARVIITLECDYETVYAKDASLTKNDKSTDEESEYIIIEQDEAEGGLLLKTVTPKIRGVAVVCSGGDSEYVKSAVTEMLTAVLDIGANHVSVSKIR